MMVRDVNTVFSDEKTPLSFLLAKQIRELGGKGPVSSPEFMNHLCHSTLVRKGFKELVFEELTDMICKRTEEFPVKESQDHHSEFIQKGGPDGD